MALNVAASIIVDQALVELELDPISSFGDDSDLARDVAGKYPAALKYCLEAEDWSFASVIADLPPATPDAPPAGDAALVYLYKLPSDCVRLRAVLDAGVTWRLDENFLRADAGDGLKIRYTRAVADEDAMPASFAEFVSLRLAIKLSPRWLQSRSKRADLHSLMKEAQADAKTADRTISSGRRWDGNDMGTDWVSEALR